MSTLDQMPARNYSTSEDWIMAHDHTFDCKQCGAHLDSQEELNKHIRDRHTAQAQSASGSYDSSTDRSRRDSAE